MAVIRSREVAAKQGFFCTIPYGNVMGTKVSGRNRQGGHLSGVAVKRGSTVMWQFHNLLVLYNSLFSIEVL